VPFVVKLPQALSGQGVFLIRTEKERNAALAVLYPETLRMLRGLNEENVPLDPCCVLVQDLVPGEAVALSLFVTKSGKAVFNACCSQLIDNEGNWGGGFVDYHEQDRLQQEYSAIIEQLASYMHKLGYWGPMGADIMTDSEGGQLVIDMNVRVTGSHPLGALKSHFTHRGLNVATLVFPLMLNLTRDQFEVEFQEELHFGSLVVNAWVHMRDRKTSMTTVTLAADSKGSLNKFLERINAFKLEMA
jgi:carbamoylphosphate synthase large subunit